MRRRQRKPRDIRFATIPPNFSQLPTDLTHLFCYILRGERLLTYMEKTESVHSKCGKLNTIINFQLVGHKSEVYENNIKELQLLKDQLDVGATQDADGAADSSIKIV